MRTLRKHPFSSLFKKFRRRKPLRMLMYIDISDKNFKNMKYVAIQNSLSIFG